MTGLWQPGRLVPLAGAVSCFAFVAVRMGFGA
jgi:hypothetical protein